MRLLDYQLIAYAHRLYKWAEWRSRPASPRQMEHLRERGLIKGHDEDGFDPESMTSGKVRIESRGLPDMTGC